MAPPPTLPIIDISPFLSTSPPGSLPSYPSTLEERQATASELNTACREYGFFYLTNHGIPTSTLDTVLALARDFFHLPQSTKNKIKRHDARSPSGGDGARGYQGMGENVTGGRRDMHEAIDLFREWGREEGEKEGPPYELLHGPNLWPDEPAELKGVYEVYIEEVKKVGVAVVRAMAAALGLPEASVNSPKDKSAEDSEVFVRNTDESFWVLRLIGYPALPAPTITTNGNVTEDIEHFSCGAHTDYGCLTLLLADPTPSALQVKVKDADSWINADPVPGAFVVNIGDMMERWTNGLWMSTKHRVIHRGEGFRVSVPFFFEPNFRAVVRPLGVCVKETGEEVKYQSVVYGEHLVRKVSGNFYSADDG